VTTTQPTEAASQPAQDQGEPRLLSLDVSPSSLLVADTLTVTLLIENSSRADTPFSVVPQVNGAEAPSLSTNVPALSTSTVRFTLMCEAPGPLEIRVGELSRTVFVRERIAVADDATADWVGPSGQPAEGAAGLDLEAFDVSCLGNEVVFRLKVHAAIPPESPAQNTLLRWDAAVDTDPGVNNGLKSAVLYNDARPDFVARVELTDGVVSGRLLTVRNNTWQDIDYSVEDSTVEMRVPLAAMGDQLNFDCVGVASTYRREGGSTNLVTADRAPETGRVAVAIRAADGAGLSDDEESRRGTNPRLADSDDDSAGDGDEVLLYGSDPLAPEDWGNLDGLAASLAMAERLAAEYDVRLGIHNHGGRHWLGSSQALRWVFAQSGPRVGLCLDTAWALDSGEDPVKMIEEFGPRLHLLHLKDFVFDRARKPEDVVVGTGNLPLAAVAAALAKVGFAGEAVLEYEGDVANPVPSVSACVKAIRKGLDIAR